MTEDGAFGHWFAGFFDGEGCFAISPGHRKGRGYRCVARLALRIDDETIVTEIQRRLDVGTLRTTPVKGGSPQIVWAVSSKSGCMKLIEFFDRFPLRAKKSQDYAIWREAVLIWATVRQGTHGPSAFDWSGMAELRRQLMEGRVFGGEPHVMPQQKQLRMATMHYTHSVGGFEETVRRAVG